MKITIIVIVNKMLIHK